MALLLCLLFAVPSLDRDARHDRQGSHVWQIHPDVQVEMQVETYPTLNFPFQIGVPRDDQVCSGLLLVFDRVHGHVYDSLLRAGCLQ